MPSSNGHISQHNNQPAIKHLGLIALALVTNLGFPQQQANSIHTTLMQIAKKGKNNVQEAKGNGFFSRSTLIKKKQGNIGTFHSLVHMLWFGLY